MSSSGCSKWLSTSVSVPSGIRILATVVCQSVIFKGGRAAFKGFAVLLTDSKSLPILLPVIYV
ncbi:hypothetical protein [Pseudoalteromonas aurantia]|uniref:hypothetical protein n=1 Tax=Pseudoalteromonas aurantia TaxID=43654 RepID=UPI002016844F|nr:hypothetical protein [Pseudoalteromonas aurantia]